jgi:peptidoglycan/LPS O-acetylase OafA/YrhL
MDTFAAGAAVVLFGDRFRRRSLTVFFGCTALLLVCGQANAIICTGKPAFNLGFGYESNLIPGVQYIWGYTLINIWAATLILAASSGTWLSRVLAFPGLAYVGRISYGMYVYHQVILLAGLLMFGSLYMNTRHGFLYYYLCVVLVSGLSFKFYESRFLALKNTRFSRPKERPNRREVNDFRESPVV